MGKESPTAAVCSLPPYTALCTIRETVYQLLRRPPLLLRVYSAFLLRVYSAFCFGKDSSPFPFGSALACG